MWRKLYFNEVIDQITGNLLRSGNYFVNSDTGLIESRFQSMAYDSNWLFSGYTTSLRDCGLWHSIMFRYYGFVPEFCKLRCYKVVVKVRNFIEAMQFYGVLGSSHCINGEMCAIHGKVGIDERYYSAGHFNGFVYCDGLEDALEKYKVVRKLVDECIPTGKEIDIIVKRTCTEFEQKFGPTDSDFWQIVTPEEQNLQRHLEDIFKPDWSSSVQPDWLKNKIIYKWKKWANTVGDKSWIDYFGDHDDLTMKAVTYHHLIKGENKNGSSEN